MKLPSLYAPYPAAAIPKPVNSTGDARAAPIDAINPPAAVAVAPKPLAALAAAVVPLSKPAPVSNGETKFLAPVKPLAINPGFLAALPGLIPPVVGLLRPNMSPAVPATSPAAPIAEPAPPSAPMIPPPPSKPPIIPNILSITFAPL